MFGKQTGKGIKSEQDLTDFRKILTKITVEAALNAELEEHLGYALHEQSNTNNSRNGYSSNLFAPKTGKLTLKRDATENAVFSRS